MKTKLIKIEDLQADTGALDEAAEILRQGGLVAMPTETVYGLAANALDKTAAKAIYAAKGRPSDNPLIVHVSSVEEIKPLVRETPSALFLLAERFWPGPLTVVLPKSERVPMETSGGLDTVAIRMPAHPIARELIRRAGVPLAAPSANRSGLPSPTTARHCMQDMDGRIDAVIDGGPCRVGVESTVFSLCVNPPAVLRPGAVTLSMLRQVLPEAVLDKGVFSQVGDGVKAASPGMKYKHYSPRADVSLVAGSRGAFRDFIARRGGEGVGALCFSGEEKELAARCIPYGREGDEASQEQALFAALRQADEMGLQKVYVHLSPAGVGDAVYNRLLRAAAFEEIEL